MVSQQDPFLKQEAYFQPNFCQTVIAWCFSLLLFCIVLSISRMFELLSSKVSTNAQVWVDVIALAMSHTAPPESAILAALAAPRSIQHSRCYSVLYSLAGPSICESRSFAPYVPPVPYGWNVIVESLGTTSGVCQTPWL